MVVNSDAAPFVAKGKTMQSASEMKAFEKGEAVDVRSGVDGTDRDGEELREGGFKRFKQY